MDFKEAFDFVIGREGGFVNDRHDPGGETNYGISKRQYPNVDIKNLTLDEASGIYFRDYWKNCKCAEMPDLVRMPLFDSAVNQGVPRAIKMLQKSVGATTDGIIGPKTMAAIHKYAGPELIVNFLAERALHYVSLKNFERYGKGWMRRLFHVSSSNK